MTVIPLKKLCLLLTLLLCVLLSACSREAPLTEKKWAYRDSPSETVLKVTGRGIEFEDTVYELAKDGEFDRLVPKKSNEPALRAHIDEDSMVLFRRFTYGRYGEDSSDGFRGAWQCTDGGNYFIFGEDGRFLEDGIFAGTYTLSEDAFVLTYDGPFESTSCFYTLEGDLLTVEYPWVLVPTR